MRDMKQMKHQVLTLAALLLASANMWAGQVVIKTSPANSGSVTASEAAAGQTCTLTVTPAEGYYLTAENLSAVTTLNSGALQTPRRADGIDVASQPVAITATDASADPSGVTTYTFTMPEDANIDVEVTAEFQTVIAISPTVSLEGWTYGTSPNTPVVSGNTGQGAETFTYRAAGSETFTEDVPTVAGTHTVKVSIAAAGKYAAGEATSEFTIGKAPVTLGFAESSVALDISQQTYKQEVTASVADLTYTWTSSDETVATVGADGTVTLVGLGTATITAALAETDNYLAAEASYTITLGRSYGITVNDVLVTEANHADVLGDGKVFFASDNRMVLSGAALNKITILEQNVLTEDGLTIYLIDQNTLTAEQPAVINQGGPVALTLSTSGTEAGSLAYQLTSATLTAPEEAFVGFSAIKCENQLALSLENNDDHSQTVRVSISIEPIVSDGTEEDKTSDIDYSEDGDICTQPLTNIVIDNVLYTLNDTQTAGADDDGFIGDYNGEVVLNSTVTDEDLDKAMNLQPGTQEYAEAFKGLTFTLPPGSGVIRITSHEAAGHALCVKIGDAEPVVLSHEELKEDTINYAVAVPTYVRIYHVKLVATALVGRRIGPKTTVTTGMTGMSVSANQVDTPPAALANYKKLSAASMKELAVEYGGGKGLVVDDINITDLEDDVFDFLRGSQQAPRRTAADDDVPFIDLRNTSIVGKVADRSKGAFRDLPANTFIYLPAGNTSVSPNVVIGSVCEDMQLTDQGGKTFLQAADFTAAKVEYSHAVSAGKRSTLYLPFDLQDAADYGTFYAYDGQDGTNVKLKVVEDGVKANVPYVVKAGDSDISKFTAKGVAIQQPKTADGAAFMGTYKQLSGDATIYRYVATTSGGKDTHTFTPLSGSETINPFEAYLKGDGTTQYTVQWSDESVPTAIRNIADEQQAPSWYHLNGQKLNKVPAKKGIYIRNGRKVVVE